MRIGALALLAVAAACSDVTQPAQLAPGAANLNTTEEPSGGARLSVVKTAVPQWTSSSSYQWSLAKTGPVELDVPLGETRTAEYLVTVTRTAGAGTEFFGVVGEICVTNNGPEATRGLRVIDQLQYWNDPASDWSAFGPETAVDVSAHPNLEPFTTYCYPYRIALDPATVPASKLGYRNTARIFIDNFKEGYEEYAHHQTQPFVFPTSPTGTSTDATATVVDVVSCPAGFTCTPGGASWAFSGSGTQTLSVQVKNVSAACNTYHDLVNRATLTSGSQTVTSEVTTTVYTGLCEVRTITGCTPGFWKQSQHAQYWTNHATTDKLGTVFTQASRYTVKGKLLSDYTLLQGLQFGGGSGEVGAAQILMRAAVAALLNNEHSGGNVAALVSSVNTALASGDRRTMLNLAETLDRANNGTCTVKP